MLFRMYIPDRLFYEHPLVGVFLFLSAITAGNGLDKYFDCDRFGLYH